MAGTKIVLRSNFRLAKKAGDEVAKHALNKAGDAMHEEAGNRLDKAAGQRGYNLYSTDLDIKKTDDEAEIHYGQWYGKFFEYGTEHILPMPFMRPGHRKGKAVLLDELGDNFEKWVRRRAGIR